MENTLRTSFENKRWIISLKLSSNWIVIGGLHFQSVFKIGAPGKPLSVMTSIFIMNPTGNGSQAGCVYQSTMPACYIKKWTLDDQNPFICGRLVLLSICLC